MAEETQEQEGTMSGLKKAILGIVTTAVVTIGGVAVNKFAGGEEPAQQQQAAPVINITNSNQQAQQAAGGTHTIVKERVVEKPAAEKPAPAPKKKEGDEFKEKPAQW
jgi:uncharacterized protein with PhoU and TrkA domain